MASLRLYFLGPLDIRSGERQLARPPTQKSQSLLAYLALHRRRPQSRDRLVSLFWAERPERRARRSLSTALWHVRRCLPDGTVLLSDAHTVQFDKDADIWLDVKEFETQLARADMAGLQSALALYRGDFLDGFYDDWVLSERYRLETLFVGALAQLMAAHEAAGDDRAALATAQRLLDRDLLREDAHRLAMRAYCRLGQRNAALEQYERCRQAVQAELGAEPVDETTNLRQAIVDGRVPVGPAQDSLPLEAQPSGRLGRSPLDVITPVRLVGRDRETGLLYDAWQAARMGHGKVALISGEAGVGKTRLVEELANHLRWQGARVLCGRCYEFERALPYQPLAEALHAALPVLSNEELAAFPNWVVLELARLVPEVLERGILAEAGSAAHSSTGGRPAVDPGHKREATEPGLVQSPVGLDQDQIRLFEAVTHILIALSGQAPLLLVVEDLHWAGESTLGLVHHLARHSTGHPVLIVGTFRPEAMGAEHPLRTLQRRLIREGLASTLQLDRLSAEAVEAMIVEMSGAGDAVAPLARRLYRETEGNPFFLIEIVKALFETDVVRLEEGAWQGDFVRISSGALPLPAGVSEAIEARARRLEASAQEALGLAAVLGREFDFDLLRAAWGQGEEATLEALEGLLRHSLIEERDDVSGGDLAFTHHKIQEVVYEALPRPRQLHWHAQAATAMETVYRDELEVRAGELAYHFERACPQDTSLCERAVVHLQRAGEQAVRQAASQEAISYYRRALEILQTLPATEQRGQQEIELLLALAQPTAVVYGYPASETRRVYDRARDLCREVGQTPALFASLVGLARYYGVGGNVESGMELSLQLLDIAQTLQDNAMLIEACRQMGGHLFSLGRLKEAQAFWERGLALYDAVQHESLAYRFGHDPAASFLGYLSMGLWLLGYPDQAQVRRRELRALLLSMAHPASLGYGHGLLAISACMRRDVVATLDHAEAAIPLDKGHGLPSWAVMATPLRGWAQIEQGQFAEGLANLRDGTAMWQARGFAHFAPLFLGLQADVYLKMGRLAEADAALSAACEVARKRELYWLPELRRLQGELASAEGRDGSEAETRFRQAIDIAREQEARMLELRATTSLARLWQEQGRRQDARKAMAEVYDRFEEGLETPELRQAATLLRARA